MLDIATRTAGGDSRTLSSTTVGVPVDGTSAVVLRVCTAGSADVRVAPSDVPSPSGTALRPGSAADGCALALVGVGQDDGVRVDRAAGSDGIRVDLVGHLPSDAPGVPFWDVASSPFVADIGWVATGRIARGHVDGTYRPTLPVSRQAMAAFLYRAAGSPSFSPPATATFDDVALGSPFHKEVEWLATTGVATGTATGDGRQLFKPTEPVSRQAMAAFLYRAYGGAPSAEPAPFTDVPGTPFAAEIAWLAETGITTGNSDGTYRPTAAVSRQAMAAFLHRADALP